MNDLMGSSTPVTCYHPRAWSIFFAIILASSIQSRSDAGVLGAIANPDIKLQGLSGSYDHVSQAFSLTGDATLYVDAAGVESTIYMGSPPDSGKTAFHNGTFTLNATVSNLGVISSGSFDIVGAFETSPWVLGTQATLLQGTLKELVHNFGTVSATATPSEFTAPLTLEISAISTDGELQSEFGQDLLLNINLDATGIDFDGNFLTSFNTNGFSTSDVNARAVPEPSSFAGWMIGAVGIGVIRVRRKRLTT
ncbi:hypothetical protein Enr13x_30610 [Stieleria neptunia]|uniref:PEP-CTERM protein-sorting domain-containing protein n=1 Tax=Stieleria neptunia TaxID=2527979 RepID=A0A518HQS4_9BACT|nr:PEP-CTERM sorting domain-containing protein [Stieleria neptunia]QDV43206.1 hypothetical protein Enr13x_30610 [Stieleria neptunia]